MSDQGKKNKGWENLRNHKFQSREEARQAGMVGGLLSGVARREKRLITDALIKVLSSKGVHGTRSDNIVHAWVEAAEGGDIKAITSITDRIEGKPVQQVQVQGNVDVAQALLSARKQVTQDE